MKIADDTLLGNSECEWVKIQIEVCDHTSQFDINTPPITLFHTKINVKKSFKRNRFQYAKTHWSHTPFTLKTIYSVQNASNIFCC